MNGNGKIESLLERIASNMERMVERQDAMTERQDAMTTALVDLAVGQEQTRQELTGLRRDMNHGFAQVNGRIDQTNARIDNVLVIAGRHSDDHEQRIQLLESHVLGKPAQR